MDALLATALDAHGGRDSREGYGDPETGWRGLNPRWHARCQPAAFLVVRIRISRRKELDMDQIWDRDTTRSRRP
jgi:hypothetical protein